MNQFALRARSVFVVAISLAIAASTADAGPVDSAPRLPAPTGTVIQVSTEPQLQAAVDNLQSNTTILIAPGTYRLTRTLHIGNRALTNVTLRGATDRRDDVVLAGPGMRNGSYGGAPHGIWTGNGVQGVLIANLTVRDFYFHDIIMNAGTDAPRVYNVRLAESGQQLLKSNPDATGKGNDRGIVEYSVFEFADTSRDYYTNGVDVLGGADWIIRHNLFRNIRAPLGQLAGPAILMWRGSSGTIVDGNTFINCQREIALGLEPATPNSHAGGIIRNNFTYRDTWVAGDAAVNVFDSPNTRVLNNTLITSGTYPNAIEYRFADTTGVLIANNLVDAAIRSRDGAVATVQNNLTAATTAMFVNAGAGDLHLLATATAAIDKGVAVAGAETDWDGEPRPAGAAPEIGADEVGGVAYNNPPAVALTSPQPGSSYVSPGPVLLAASATDSDGAVVRVDFFQGGQWIAGDAEAPFATSWSGVAPGSYEVTAVAEDNLGARATSAPVNISVSSIQASQVTVMTIGDAHVRGGRFASRNYGAATQLEVKTDTAASDMREAFIAFDLTSLASVTSAKLRIHGATKGPGQGLTTQVLAAGGANWTEQAVTWNSAPRAGLAPAGTVTLTGVGQWYEVDVTAAVLNARAAGQTRLTVVLKNPAYTTKQVAVFSSRESGSGPVLVVTP